MYRSSVQTVSPGSAVCTSSRPVGRTLQQPDRLRQQSTRDQYFQKNVLHAGLRAVGPIVGQEMHEKRCLRQTIYPSLCPGIDGDGVRAGS